MQGIKAGLAGLLVVLSALVAVPARAATVVPGRALMIGDSLAYESRDQIQALMTAHKGWYVGTQAFGGSAPCDWVQWLPSSLTKFRPTVIGILSAGNTGDGCMVDPHGAPIPFGSAAFYAKYQADLTAFVGQATAAGVKVVLFSPPPFADPVRNTEVKQLVVIQTAIAYQFHGVSIAGSVRTAFGGSKYLAYKTCFPTETAAMGCANGSIAIRTVPPAVDAGLHLCPSGIYGVAYAICPTYSSGEYRFGRAVVASLVKPPPPKLP